MKNKNEKATCKIEVLEPYKHDCPICKWVGWFTPFADKPPMNVYLCNETVVIRFSSEGSDYWTMPVGMTTKGPIEIRREIPPRLNMQVSFLYNKRGNPIKNAFIITTNETTYLLHYEKIISAIYEGKIFLDKCYYNYSETTSSVRNLFLNLTSKEVKEKIKSGEIILTNLN